MIFPDCKNDDVYNEDFLNTKDLEFVRGCDYAFDKISNLFENNLDVYASCIGKMSCEILEQHKGEISCIIKHWFEQERNQMITTMIDSMNDDEYVELRTVALEKNIEKEYFDTRKFFATGSKEKTKTEE